MSKEIGHVFLEIKVSQNSEVGPEGMLPVYGALVSALSTSWLNRFLGKTQTVSLEIWSISGEIHFGVSCPIELQPLLESEISGSYPLVRIEPITPKNETINFITVLQLTAPSYLPLKSYKDFRDTDPLVSIWSALSRVEGFVHVQFILWDGGNTWIQQGRKVIQYGSLGPGARMVAHPLARDIETKINEMGLTTSLRITGEHKKDVQLIASAYCGLGSMGKNSLKIKWLNKKSSSSTGTLSLTEMATLFHLPSKEYPVLGIAWAQNLLNQPPDNLIIGTNIPEEQKKSINFIVSLLI